MSGAVTKVSMEGTTKQGCRMTLLFCTVRDKVSQKGLWWGCITLPSNATDHCIIRMDDVAFSLVMLDNSMSCSEKAFSFRFTSVGKFLSGSPSHAMDLDNDACAVFVHLTVLVNDAGRVPGLMHNGATGFVALSIETLCVRGTHALCRGECQWLCDDEGYGRYGSSLGGEECTKRSIWC